MRTTTSTIVFTRPFRLPGFDQAHAPGTFEVKTDEERLDTAFEGWHRVATTIRLVDRGRIQTWPKSFTSCLKRRKQKRGS